MSTLCTTVRSWDSESLKTQARLPMLRLDHVRCVRGENKTSGNCSVTNRVMVFVWAVDAEKGLSIMQALRATRKAMKFASFRVVMSWP